MDFLTRLKIGLNKTRAQIRAMVGTPSFDDGFYENLEEALIAADIGVDFSSELVERLRQEIENNDLRSPAAAYDSLKKMIVSELSSCQSAVEQSARPWVIMVVGVNGVGKTTTIGKMAHRMQGSGKQLVLGAADTFRAGAIEQLRIWAERTHSGFVAQQPGSDAASVAFDALQAARSRDADVLILDTAGRLHTKVNLMAEIEKVVRVVKRSEPAAPHEVLLVIDATTGQNALKQAQAFDKSLGLTGLVITKLDGTAKGGIALALTRELKVPIRMIGVGESMDDLQDFDPVAYVDAMLGDLA